jgi:amino acid adenylation domain-containing protein
MPSGFSKLFGLELKNRYSLLNFIFTFSEQMSTRQFLPIQPSKNPAAIAIKDAARELTYEQLNTQVNQLANYLSKQGVQPESLVGIYADRSIDLVIAILAVLQAGGAYVPLDPAYPPARLAAIIADTQLQLVLTQSHLVPDLKQPELDLPELNLILLDTDWSKVARESPELVAVATTPANLAYIMYTSGSTGKPQGVQITIGQVECYLQAVNQVLNIQADDIYLHSASFSFSSSIRQLLLPLAQGAKVVITSKENTTNLFSLIELIQTEQITVFDTVASVWNYILIGLAEMDEAQKSRLMNSRIRLLTFSGGLLTAQLLERVRSQFQQSPQIVNIYGQTETIGVCAYQIPAESIGNTGYAPVGIAYSHNQLYVLDDRLQPVATAQTGELYVSGASLARGYLNNHQLNDRKFIPNPFSQEKQSAWLYKTGDLARYLPDGNLEIVGRQDFQVKIRGMRVEIEEIETVLTQHPAVQQAAVVGKENSAGETIIVAYIVPNCPQIDVSDLRSFLKTKLTDYMMPSAVEILDALPLTPNNKLDRKRLPEPSRENLTVVAPRDDLEHQLVQIWEQVLDLKNIGIDDNFFDLGGHSLVALQLFAEIEKIWHKKFLLAVLLESPTIAGLAQVIRTGKTPDWSPVVLLKPSENKSPLFCVHPLGGNLFDYHTLSKILDIHRPIYGLQPRGIDGKQQPYERIEDMASYFIQSIKTIQPQGPYFIVGYSFGGIVAFDIARQLTEQGEKIAFLGLIDIRCPVIAELDTPFREWIEIQLDRMRKMTIKEQFDYLIEKLFYPKSQVYRDEVVATLSDLDLFTPELVKVLDCNVQAVKEYQPQIFAGRATLFWSEYQDWYIKKHPTLGWGDLIADHLDLQRIPGNHITLMREPHVQVLAEKLSSSIAQAAKLVED